MKSFLSALAGLGLLAAAAPANAGLLYGVDSVRDTLFSIDTTSFVRTTVGSLGTDVRETGLAYDPNTDTLFMTNRTSDLYTVDRNTGAASIVGSLGINNAVGLAFDSLNNVLYGNQLGVFPTLFTLDTLTGAPTTIGALANNFGGLAYDSTRDRLLGHHSSSGLYEIDRATGVQTLLVSSRILGGGGLAYDPDLDLFWSSNSFQRLVTFDPNNGFAPTTQLSGRIGGSDSFAFVSTAVAPTPVPEPSSLAAIGIGLLAIGAFARRRRAS